MVKAKQAQKTAKKLVKDEPMTVKDNIALIGMLKKVSDDATEKINDLKNKFNDFDSHTKKNIITGLSVVAAGLVVLAGVNKVKNNNKKRKATK